MLAGVRFVAQYGDRLVDMADDQVRTATILQVANRQPAAEVLTAEIGAALQADVTEPAIPLVPQQHRPLFQPRPVRKANHMAIGDHQVFPTMIVQVEEAGAEADVELADGRDTRCRRIEQEQSVALVAVQAVHLVFVVGAPQGTAATAVVVADVGSHAA